MPFHTYAGYLDTARLCEPLFPGTGSALLDQADTSSRYCASRAYTPVNCRTSHNHSSANEPTSLPPRLDSDCRSESGLQLLPNLLPSHIFWHPRTKQAGQSAPLRLGAIGPSALELHQWYPRDEEESHRGNLARAGGGLACTHIPAWTRKLIAHLQDSQSSKSMPARVDRTERW